MQARLGASVARHRVSIAVLTPLLVVVGVVHGVGMSSYPAFFDDEGTYMAQAWAVQSQHALSPYTYWYDHPPLGWLILAGWSSVARVFEHDVPAVIVGRQAMWSVGLASAVAVYVLARRLEYRRPAAWFATAIFSLSPLSVTYQRMVFLDNIAVLWLLLSFVFVLSPSRRLWAYAAAGGCLAAAVLSKETMLLAAPAVVWQGWRHAEPRTRQFCMALLGSTFVFGSATYPLFAFLKGELFPGTGHVSLFSALRFQLVTRPGTGSVFDPHSASHAIVTGWLHLDAWLLIVACALIPFGLARPRLRPLTTALALEAVVVLRSGYLPAPQVLVVLPFAALLITGAAQDVTDLLRARVAASGATRRVRLAHRGIATFAALPIVLFPAIASPDWFAAYRVAAAEDLTSPVVAGEHWIEQHVDRNARILVDDVVWIDLVRHGFDPHLGVVWFYKLDFTNNPDPSVQRRLPAGWRDFDYVVVTPTMRSALDALPGGLTEVRAAIAHSYTVAAFGHGDHNVEIRQIGSRPRHTIRPPAEEAAPRCPRAATDLIRKLAALTGIPPDLAGDIWTGCRPSDDVLRRAEAIIAARRAAAAASPNDAQRRIVRALFPELSTAPGRIEPPSPAPAVPPHREQPAPAPPESTSTTLPDVTTTSPATAPRSTTTTVPSPNTTTPTSIAAPVPPTSPAPPPSTTRS
jgi:4-amino-4-deoxy-L-arabinose transferase-like glycosyltransferase